jgi:hypothetical protein
MDSSRDIRFAGQGYQSSLYTLSYNYNFNRSTTLDSETTVPDVYMIDITKVEAEYAQADGFSRFSGFLSKI